MATDFREGTLHASTPHDLTRQFIGVVDKNCRIRWSSSNSNVGKSAMDFYPDNIREMVFEKFSRCIVMRTTECFTAGAFDGPSEPRCAVTWKVTIVPFDFRELACIVVATVLPDHYYDLTPDDLIVLRLMSQDNQVKDIAHSMNRSKSAIDARIKSMKLKLNCTTIGGLVALALQTALI